MGYSNLVLGTHSAAKLEKVPSTNGYPLDCYDCLSTRNSYVLIEKTYLEGGSMWSFVLHLVASFPGILFCILYFILSAQQCKFHLWPFYLFRQESAAFKGNLVLIFQRDLDAKLKHPLPTKHGIKRGLCR